MPMPTVRAVMGFDPGISGGLAVLNAAGGLAFVRGFNRDMTELQVEEILKFGVQVLQRERGWECFMEKVGFIKGDRGKGSFTFGGAYKFARGYLRAKDVVIYDVPPLLWQARMECLTGGDKNVSKRRAIELFPGVKVTHAIGDALLIALYGRNLG